MNAEASAPDLTLSWLTDASRVEELTALFLSAIHPSYMSHGDMMEGRAPNPGRWADDLPELHAAELAALQFEDGRFDRPGVRIALAEDTDGLVGYAMVALLEHDAGRAEPVRFARVDDVVVDPERRSRGVGALIVTWVEERLRESGVPRAFLESGIGNTGAHRFFERLGYSVISLSMMKDL